MITCQNNRKLISTNATIIHKFSNPHYQSLEFQIERYNPLRPLSTLKKYLTIHNMWCDNHFQVDGVFEDNSPTQEKFIIGTKWKYSEHSRPSKKGTIILLYSHPTLLQYIADHTKMITVIRRCFVIRSSFKSIWLKPWLLIMRILWKRVLSQNFASMTAECAHKYWILTRLT